MTATVGVAARPAAACAAPSIPSASPDTTVAPRAATPSEIRPAVARPASVGRRVPTIAIELGGGLLLAIGYKTRWAALAIFLLIIPATLIFHAFWSATPENAMSQAINFQKNIAIMGGMLYVYFCGPGRFSVDGR